MYYVYVCSTIRTYRECPLYSVDSSSIFSVCLIHHFALALQSHAYELVGQSRCAENNNIHLSVTMLPRHDVSFPGT